MDSNSAVEGLGFVLRRCKTVTEIRYKITVKAIRFLNAIFRQIKPLHDIFNFLRWRCGFINLLFAKLGSLRRRYLFEGKKRKGNRYYIVAVDNSKRWLMKGGQRSAMKQAFGKSRLQWSPPILSPEKTPSSSKPENPFRSLETHNITREGGALASKLEKRI